MSRIVAIVGRPNVGKSTLFNRFTETRQAIVHESSGVTRDRHYGKVLWNGEEFSVIDTGGYVTNSEDVFEEEIRKQVLLAIEEADFVIFVTDVQLGITDMDDAVAHILRKSKKKVAIAVNKVDTTMLQFQSAEFYGLGLENLFSISAISGSGTGELLDFVVSNLPPAPTEIVENALPNFTIVGRPNVGKSSLINALIGVDRNIVTPISGTTRDTIKTHYNKYGLEFNLIDTAGIRKKGKVHENIEFYSVMRSVRAIEDSDVCILMLDAERGIEAQDLNIFHLIERNSKGVVVLINKWDLVEKDHNTAYAYEKQIRERLEPYSDVPIIFTSATTKQRIHKALEAAMEVHKNRSKRIPTSKLNEVMLPEIEAFPPPSNKGKFIKIKYVTQLPTFAPHFAFYCNLPQYVKEPYKRFIENKIRLHFNFTGVPIQIFFRKK